jgi:hypothetical protein
MRTRSSAACLNKAPKTLWLCHAQSCATGSLLSCWLPSSELSVSLLSSLLTSPSGTNTARVSYGCMPGPLAATCSSQSCSCTLQ